MAALTYGENDCLEATLGLQWDCETDKLQHHHRPVDSESLNMRNMYKTLARQYDPIGYLTPFTTRARVIVQDLWKTNRNWDDVLEPGVIRDDAVASMGNGATGTDGYQAGSMLHAA